jgi:hypothetical protein
LAREEAAFFGDVRDAIIPMIFPAPQVQIGQASTWTRNLAMFHEPSASAVMPMAVGSAPQKSLSGIDSLLRRIKISATGRAEHIIRVVFPTLINICSPAAGITELPAALACVGGVLVLSAWTARAFLVQSLFFSDFDRKFLHFLPLRPTPFIMVCGVVEHNINLSVRFVKGYF